MDLLVSEGKETKDTNFLGRYTSPNMSLWYNLKTQFESKNIYLASVAQILIQNIKYEMSVTTKFLHSNLILDLLYQKQSHHTKHKSKN